MEGWVNNWLTGQRELGEKGLEVKKFSNGYYAHLPQKSTKIPPIFPIWQ